MGPCVAGGKLRYDNGRRGQTTRTFSRSVVNVMDPASRILMLVQRVLDGQVIK